MTLQPYNLQESITAALRDQRGFTGLAPRSKFGADADGFPLNRPEMWESRSKISGEERAEALRLVKVSKSPTPQLLPQKALALPDRFRTPDGYDYDQAAADPETGEIPRHRTGEYGPQRYTIVTHREWSGEYRIRTGIDQPASRPPEQQGTRITNQLTLDGARKIADSAHYMHLHHGGYRTFITLTFDDASRSRIEPRIAAGECVEVELLRGKYITRRKPRPVDPLTSFVDHVDLSGATGSDGPYTPVQLHGGQYVAAATRAAGDDMTYSTIQKEVSRFFDAAQRMRQRGWQSAKCINGRKYTCYEREGKPVGESPSKVVGIKGAMADRKMKPIRQGISYCWVVENPLNEGGKRNPHVHVLMDWRVKYSAFASWADRLESIWGQGFATIEKIRETDKAGYYLAKAAGYLTDSAKGDQGPVRGNRYFISKYARAPQWAEIGRFELGIMGHLIADAHDFFNYKYGHLYAKRNELRTELQDLPKKAKVSRAKVRNALERTRSELDVLPFVSSRYQLICKDKAGFLDFINWASTGTESPYLPPKEADENWDPNSGRPSSAWMHKFLMNMHARRADRRGADIPDHLYYEDSEPEAPEQLPTPEEWRIYENYSDSIGLDHESNHKSTRPRNSAVEKRRYGCYHA